jgi:hypothetical protein
MVPRVRFLCVIVLVCAASCAPGHAESPEVNGRHYFGSLAAPAGQLLRFNLGTEPELRDPGTMSGQPDGRFARLVFEGLTTSDPRTLEPRAGQAYRWDVSADGLTYTFHLRPGLRWEDGSALTSRDFRWSWLRVLAPVTASRNASLFYAVRGAEEFNKGADTSAASVGLATPDDSTFVVTLARPTAYFLFLTTYYAFLPVPRAVVERWGIHWTLPEHLVGNGPFSGPLAAERTATVRAVADVLGSSGRSLENRRLRGRRPLHEHEPLQVGRHRLEPEQPSRRVPALRAATPSAQAATQARTSTASTARGPVQGPVGAPDPGLRHRPRRHRARPAGKPRPWGAHHAPGYPGYEAPDRATRSERANASRAQATAWKSLPAVHHPVQHQ